MRQVRWLVAGMATLAVAVGAGACGGSDNGSDTAAAPATAAATSTASSDPITIGFVIGKTGLLESYDVPAQTTAQFAIDDINKEGGVGGRQLKSIVADMKSKPELAGTAATEVIDKGAEVIVTPCDFDYGSPAAIVAQEQGMIGISTCAASTNFGPQGVGDLAYTMGTAGVTEGAAAAEWATEEKGWKTAYLLYDNTLDQNKQASAAFKERFASAGGKLVGEDTFKQDDQSIGAQVTRIKGMDTPPDFIYMSSYQPGFAKALKQVRAAGIDVPVVGGSDLDGDYWKDGVGPLNDIYFTTYGSIYGDDPDPKVNDLVERYKQQTGKQPDVSAFLTGYPTIQALAKAIEQAGSTDGKAMTEKMQAFTDEPFLLTTTYTPEWHISLKRDVRIMQIQDGKTTVSGTWKTKEVPTPKG